MDALQIDWLVVLLAAIVNMIIGFVWYSKWLFGSFWLKITKKDPKTIKMKWTTPLYAFIASLVIAFFLAFFESFLGVTNVTDGMFVGFCLWLGFVATTEISSVLWESRPISLFFLHTGCRFLSYIVMGGLLGA